MKKPATAAQARRPGLTITPIAAACALLLVTAAQAQEAAPAQDAPAQQVVVTGIRGSIENSIAIKKNSDSIVEAITAEDIGKLPDSSIAESIARLPGLTAQRVAGRAQVISIRGLSGDFATTLLNGREQASTSQDRSAEFDQYPSELLSGVTVYKTPDASMVAQGLAGTVDLHAVRPLDMKGRTVAVNLRGEHNGNGKLNSGSSANGGRLSVSYIDQFLDNKLGIALGYAHLDSPGQQKEYKSWWWGNQMFGTADTSPDQDVVGLKGAEVTATSRAQKRDGLMAVVDFKPNRDVRSTLDLYYSQFDQHETMRGMMWDSSQWSNASVGANPHIDTINGTRLLTGGTLTGLEPVVRNDDNQRNDKLFAIGWNNNLRLANKWTLNSDLSYSSAKRKESTLETYAGLGPKGTGATDNNFQFQIPTGAGLPRFTSGVDYTDPSVIQLTDPAGWGHDATMHHPLVKDTIGAAKLTARHDLDFAFFHDVEFGANFSKREKSHSDESRLYFLKNDRAMTAVDPSLIQPSTSLGFGGIPGVLSIDAPGALARYYDIQPADTDVALQDFTITEKQSLGFVKLGIDTDLGKIPVRGNVGLQYVHVNQLAQGKASNDGVITAVQDGTSYNDVLPSLNLNFDLGQYLGDTYLRFGAAKTMARPRMSDMRAGASGGIDPTTHMWSGGGGNPKLEPWRANSYDLSLEHYMGKGSYVSAAYFFKNLKSYIYNQQRPFDFTGFPNPSNAVALQNIGTMDQPANGQGGFVRGVELAASQQFGSLWAPLDGFGAQASLSGTDSSIHPNGPDTTQKLPGLSGVVRNITLFYEKNGFSTRVSQRYRSAYRGEVTGLFAQRSFSEILAEKQVDFQASYEFQEGTYKNLSLLFQVNNLNNSPYQTKQGDPFASGAYAPERYTTYGRQVLLGLNYKL